LSAPNQETAALVAVDLVTYYTEAGMDYRAWSRNFNMQFGFYRWGMNPLALESMLEEMSRQVFRRLTLHNGMKVLDLGCGLGAPARALIRQHDVAATAVPKVEWQLAMAQRAQRGDLAARQRRPARRSLPGGLLHRGLLPCRRRKQGGVRPGVLSAARAWSEAWGRRRLHEEKRGTAALVRCAARLDDAELAIP
jgi:hypothetical protein